MICSCLEQQIGLEFTFIYCRAFSKDDTQGFLSPICKHVIIA